MRSARILVVAGAALALAACTSSGSPTATSSSPTATPTSASPTTTSASPTSESPTPTPTSASPSTTAGVTLVTLSLQDDANCPGGRLGAHNTLVAPVWEKFTKIPTSGTVVVAVPTKYTKSLAFDIQCRSWPNTGAVPIVVLQYEGTQPGDVPPTNGKGQPLGEQGSYCWAGTREATSAITVRAWIDQGDGSPLSGKVALYADPTVATVGFSRTGQRWDEAPDGQMGHQDEPYC
ncbi:MAG TPA: hypothetical protein VFL59_08125 [Candidatus Nanopelagicales bacterium]|nr:hypothetical protein [Candidatus Nanopelagicales bacterium]